jgi:hypothetical protein
VVSQCRHRERYDPIRPKVFTKIGAVIWNSSSTIIR